MGGLFIGLTVTMDILAGGHIIGAAMNPARYIGPALMGGGLQYFWLYWLGPLAGGAAAALLYHCILEEKYKVSLKDVSAVELQGLIQQLNNLNHKLRREEI
jgi:aquaporin Z